MSTLWTPGGEHDVGHRDPTPASPVPPPTDSDPEGRAEMERLRRELAEMPAEIVVANHCYGLFELAALHLSDQPPRPEPARLAIDALAAVVDSLGSRLGPAFPQLTEALSQIRLAFVQITAAPVVGQSDPTRPGESDPNTAG
ncbi:MAG: hypothetical protein ACRD0I_10750 [Acidimicrobiales bacterium]